MDLQQNQISEELVDNIADIELNKPSKSRFLFLLFFFGNFIFMMAVFYGLHTHKYESNADVKVPGSSLYQPKYK